MSYPPPYRSGTKEWKTLAGIERATERFKGKFKGFHNGALHIEWPEGGLRTYPATVESDHTKIELQLSYDLSP